MEGLGQQAGGGGHVALLGPNIAKAAAARMPITPSQPWGWLHWAAPQCRPLLSNSWPHWATFLTYDQT